MKAKLKPSDQFLDLIVPAYNNPDITQRCLTSLFYCAPKGTRIIYVDNGSEDPDMAGIGRWVERSGGIALRLDKNQGPYAAVNAGLAVGDSMLVGVVCNDVVVLPGTIEALLNSLRPELGMPLVGATQLANNEWSLAECLPSAQEAKKNPKLVASQGYFTCFIGFRSLFEDNAVGLFDEQFKLTFGDTDWEERYRKAGLIYVQASHAAVYHGHSTTRKRLGVEADVKADSADHRRFCDKWSSDADVMARHGFAVDDKVRAATTANTWSTTGEKV